MRRPQEQNSEACHSPWRVRNHVDTRRCLGLGRWIDGAADCDAGEVLVGLRGVAVGSFVIVLDLLRLGAYTATACILVSAGSLQAVSTVTRECVLYCADATCVVAGHKMVKIAMTKTKKNKR